VAWDFKLLDNLKAIRFGPGVVGKTVLAFWGIIVLLVALGVTTPDLTFKFVALGTGAFLFVLTCLLNVYFVNRHPGLALIEGQTVVAYQRFQAEAKGLANPPEDQPAITSPIRPLSLAPANDLDEDAENG
jgi:hypothetical protein